MPNEPQTTKPNQSSEVPEYARGFKTEADTLAELRKVRPTLHRTTLLRMRRRKEIEHIQFGGAYYYRPESVFENRAVKAIPANN